MEETAVPGNIHRQTLSHIVVSSSKTTPPPPKKTKGDRRGSDRKVVGYTTTRAKINSYHH